MNTAETRKVASEMVLINEEIAANSRKQSFDIPTVTDPHLREINEKYVKNVLGSSSDLKCPKCGAPDRGNTWNGKPWCFKCNVALSREGETKPKVSKDKYPKNVTFKPLD